MMCAVIGMLASSPTDPPAIPSIRSASRRVTSLPAGIHDGFGSPCPCRDTSRSRNRPFRRESVSELSSDCMTSTMIVCSDQPLSHNNFATSRGLRRISRSALRQRGPPGPPSVSTDCSRPIAFDPLPYRTGSTCVCASGWNDDVIATPVE